MKKNKAVMVGGPSEDFPPRDVREARKRDFAERCGMNDPSFSLVNREEDIPRAQLIFSIFPEGDKDEGQFGKTLRELSWFLQGNYPVNALRRSSGMVEDFQHL